MFTGKKIIVSSLLAGALAIQSFASQAQKDLMVIVTSGDSVTQLMSMVLSTQAKQKGANVDILLCGAAGDLAVQGSNEVLLKPKNVSPQMLLKKLISSGTNVEVCPPYLPNAGKTEADLLEGVSVAKPPMVADKLLSENTQILSY